MACLVLAGCEELPAKPKPKPKPKPKAPVPTVLDAPTPPPVWEPPPDPPRPPEPEAPDGGLPFSDPDPPDPTETETPKPEWTFDVGAVKEQLRNPDQWLVMVQVAKDDLVAFVAIMNGLRTYGDPIGDPWREQSWWGRSFRVVHASEGRIVLHLWSLQGTPGTQSAQYRFYAQQDAWVGWPDYIEEFFFHRVD